MRPSLRRANTAAGRGVAARLSDGRRRRRRVDRDRARKGGSLAGDVGGGEHIGVGPVVRMGGACRPRRARSMPPRHGHGLGCSAVDRNGEGRKPRRVGIGGSAGQRKSRVDEGADRIGKAEDGRVEVQAEVDAGGDRGSWGSDVARHVDGLDPQGLAAFARQGSGRRTSSSDPLPGSSRLVVGSSPLWSVGLEATYRPSAFT